MSHFDTRSTVRPQPDAPMADIADYVHNYNINSEVALDTSRYILLDTIGCGLEALPLSHKKMHRHSGPTVPGTSGVPNGTRVPVSITNSTP